MTIATRSERYNFNNIDKIIYPIHLIPFFESPEAAKVALENGIKEYDFEKYLVNFYSDKFAFENFYN